MLATTKRFSAMADMVKSIEIGLTVGSSLDYCALKWKKRQILSEMSEISPNGRETKASRTSSKPVYQEKRGVEDLETRKSRPLLYNSVLKDFTMSIYMETIRVNPAYLIQKRKSL